MHSLLRCNSVSFRTNLVLNDLQIRLAKRINLNTQTLSGWTPLHIAVRHAHEKIVEFLLKQKVYNVTRVLFPFITLN